ncbi:autotransporter outer membrane beta-barrel domain-containing protein [Tardiphaga sp. 768_D3_N2_1]|uniref:autotransporter outer membrane beta-barrel domain-containing protein n=1 Tax=Tardiphaga sp. 768_D3_N2_1 TaxID=3240783 RepID=UPI003F89D7C6
MLAVAAVSSTGLSNPGRAQDATWSTTPATSNFADGNNWIGGSRPTQDTGSAFFGASTITDLQSAANNRWHNLTLNADAGDYTLTFSNYLQLKTAGVIINGGSLTLKTTSGGLMEFVGTASAGTANIVNDGRLGFYGNSTAGDANITNNGTLEFRSSTGGTGGNAALTNNAGALFEIIYSVATPSDAKTRIGSLAGAGLIYLGGGELTIGSNGRDTTFAGEISDCGAGGFSCNAGGSNYGLPGSIVKTGIGTLTLSGANTYTGGTTLAGGTLSVSSDANLGWTGGGLTFTGGTLRTTAGFSSGRNIALGTGGGILQVDTGTLELSGTISDSGATPGGLTKRGAGTLLLSESSNDYSGLTSIEAGTLQVGATGLPSMNSRHDIAAGATFDLNGSLFAAIGSLTGAGTVTTTAGDARLVTAMDNTTATFAGTIKDGTAGKIEVWIGGFGSTGTAIFTGANTYTGGTVICDCATLQLGNGGTTGSIVGDVDNGGTLIFNRSNSYTFAGVISDSAGTGKVIQAGGGNTILTGQSTYTGETVVNAGTLSVNGSIAPSSLTTVNAGATLGGTGTVGNTLINGGILAPGNSIGTLTVAGNLVLTTAATYLVEVSGAAADRTIVTGNATLAGALVIRPDARLSATTTYTFLTAAGISGAFDTATVIGNFARNPRYSLIGGNLQLTLDPGWLSPVLPDAATTNQRNVAAAVDNALNGGNALPAGLNALFNLGGNDLLRALSQASGETGVGLQQTSMRAMNLFLGVMTDPGIAGRTGLAPISGASAFAGEALAYAPRGSKRSASERDAFGLVTKAAPRAPVFDASWNVWAAGFGGSQTTDGNTAIGSNTTTSRTYGFAVGADYLWAPQTIAGFALAGGGTTFSVANGGTGSSDLFQAGAYLRHTTGSAYLTAAAAYGWQDVTTDRSVTAAGFDRLRGRFHANAFSGRVELGNRFNEPYLFNEPWTNGVGLTPYAAVQITALDLPAYAESLVAGTGNFALAYDGKTVTAPRTELGLRADKSFALDGALLTLRGRAAWAHDYQNDRTLQATFQALPGASFVVNGAMAARDAALTSASAEVTWQSGFSLAATFEGEFSDTTRSYAGKGVVRYTW